MKVVLEGPWYVWVPFISLAISYAINTLINWRVIHWQRTAINDWQKACDEWRAAYWAQQENLLHLRAVVTQVTGREI